MELSMVSGSILMIEEAVGRLRVSTCLYISHLSHFSDPVRMTPEFCHLLNEHRTSWRLYIRAN